nr:T9SS type A sorting domain-containing protein [Chitinophagales bacterium]
ESGISGDKSDANRGLSDYWVVKTDANGSKLWDEDYGGADDDKVHCVPQTMDGGYLLAGHTYSNQNGDISQPNRGLNDYWIVKLSSTAPSQNYFKDADGDGYGNLNGDTLSFSQPPGYVLNSSDCNDANSNIHPGKSDVCNGIDDDCNSIIDQNEITGAAIIPEGSISECPGIPVLLTAYPSTGVSYQWLKNGQPIPGATNRKFTTEEAGFFEVVEMNNFNCAATPNGVSINRITSPEAIITPNGLVNLCVGSTTTLSANYNSVYSYQWYKGTTKIVGATNPVYSTNSGGSYTVAESFGSNCSSVSSPTVISLAPKPSAEITVFGNLDICSTGTVTLKTNIGSGYTYQWKKGFSNIEGATNKAYTANMPGNYKVVITNSYGCSKMSPVITVYKSCKMEGSSEPTQPLLVTFPNPSDGQFTINLHLNDPTDATATMHLINLLGQNVFTAVAPIIDGELNYGIQINNEVPEGIYLLQVLINNVNYSTRLQLIN